MGISRAGAKPNGGNARAPTAPAEKPMSRRGQPHAKMTPRLRAPSASTVAGCVETEEVMYEVPILANHRRPAYPDAPRHSKERVSGTVASLPFRPASAPPGARRPDAD